jgi:hypothetical protein
MATIPTNGSITLATLKNAYGGSNPISLKDYYRSPYGLTTDTKPGGTLVMQPDTFQNGIWCPYGSNNGSGWWLESNFENLVSINFLNEGDVYSGRDQGATSITTGGWTYYRGSLEVSSTFNEGYEVRREKITSDPPLKEPTTGWMPYGVNNSSAQWISGLPGSEEIKWKGYRAYKGAIGTATVIEKDGWVYYRGPLDSTNEYGVKFYQLRREQKTFDEPANTSIPNSGTIKLGDFRGAYYD